MRAPPRQQIALSTSPSVNTLFTVLVGDQPDDFDAGVAATALVCASLIHWYCRSVALGTELGLGHSPEPDPSISRQPVLQRTLRAVYCGLLPSPY